MCSTVENPTYSTLVSIVWYHEFLAKCLRLSFPDFAKAGQSVGRYVNAWATSGSGMDR